MIDKIRLGRWDNAISSWGQGLNVAQLLWGLRIAVIALAVLACVYALFQLVVLMTASTGQSVEQVNIQGSPQAQNPAAELNVEAVKSWGWSSDREAGSVDVAPSAVAQDSVKQTRLKMRLEGIVKAGSDEDSVAMIEINKQSKQYQSGAKLPVGARVYLRTIEVDRIILDNNGSLEELLLFDKNLVNQRRSSSAPAPAAGQGGVIDKSANQDVTAMMGRYRQQIQQNPGSINKLIKFSVHTQDGKLAGFKVGAANNRSDFAQLGLEDGDVVTHVNGVELSDYRKALSLYQEMGDLSEVRVQLIRQGQPQELVFTLPGEG